LLTGLTVLAALSDTPNYSRVAPELAAQVGWLCLGLLVVLLAWLAARMESVRRSFLALEDPRMFAVMRIGVALMTIQCFWNLKPYWRMLFSDEGLYTVEEARSRLGSAALSGWTPVDGFLDGWAYLKFLWGKHAVFLIDGSPEFVETYMYLFFAVLLLYAAGVLSRVTGLVAWLMMSSIYNHNALYLEGTDTVYRVFFFILLFARTGAAWSVDNVVRCWWLRRRGQLQGKVYPLIPSWPRYLMMGQLVAIYTSTGLVKTGVVWQNGDALYYALNLDHFYRFEGLTQQVSAAFGTTLFRLMTWVTLWWESCFGVLVLGMILKFGLDHRERPWYRAQDVLWRRWLARALLLGAYLVLYRIMLLAYPYCVDLPKDANSPATARIVDAGISQLHLIFAGIIPAATLVWFVLGRWPLRTRRFTIDQGWLRRWLLGRRLWLGLGLTFHGFLILFMNIGMFPFIMLMTYAAWLTGEEFAAGLRWLVALLQRSPLGRLLPARWFTAASALAAPAQAAEDVPTRGRSLPDLLVVALGLGLLWLIWQRVNGERELGTQVYVWMGVVLAVGLGVRFLRPRPLGGAPALAYGAPGRALALGFLVSHALVVGLSLAPNYPIFSNWRGPTRALFGGWMSVTGTAQSWKMFAPNPPRANVFMKTVVVLKDGTRWNVGNNAYDWRPNPWIWNDRLRKMHRRMLSKGQSYLRAWSNFHCREWLLATGEHPASVEIFKLVTKIPTPEQVASKGYYDPYKLPLTQELVETHACPLAGDLPPFMKVRRGIPLSPEEQTLLDSEAEREARSAESKRRSWATRRDWGGAVPPTPTPATPSPVTPSHGDDEPAVKGGEDGE